MIWFEGNIINSTILTIVFPHLQSVAFIPTVCGHFLQEDHRLLELS